MCANVPNWFIWHIFSIGQFTVSLLWCMFSKYGIKVIINWHAAWDVCHTSIELWENFIVQSHYFFHSLLSHRQSCLLQTSHWETDKKREPEAMNKSLPPHQHLIQRDWTRVDQNQLCSPLLFKRPKNVSSLFSFLSDSISTLTSISIIGIAIDRFHE